MTTFSGLFGGAAGAGQVNAPHSGYRSGGYYFVNATRPGATSSGSTGLTSGTTYYSPFYVHSDITISGFCFYNTSSSEAGKKARIGIYASDGGRPGTLLIAASEITIGATSALREATLSQALTKGWYWGAIITDGMSVTRLQGSDLFDCGWSMESGPPDGSSQIRTSVSGTYGALPSTPVLPTSSSQSPIFYLKVA